MNKRQAWSRRKVVTGLGVGSAAAVALPVQSGLCAVSGSRPSFRVSLERLEESIAQCKSADAAAHNLSHMQFLYHPDWPAWLHRVQDAMTRAMDDQMYWTWRTWQSLVELRGHELTSEDDRMLREKAEEDCKDIEDFWIEVVHRRYDPNCTVMNCAMCQSLMVHGWVNRSTEMLRWQWLGTAPGHTPI